jgi:beta-glucosidase
MIGDVLVLDLQIMVPFAYEQFIGNLTQMVKSGAIPMSRIDDAVTRILRVKFQMVLFESPYANTKLSKALGEEVTFVLSESLHPR